MSDLEKIKSDLFTMDTDLEKYYDSLTSAMADTFDTLIKGLANVCKSVGEILSELTKLKPYNND